ncbi:hypothetical protein K491DRAFT_677687 [Lophiostoma macrostomum CBS 122681]|uniref:BHLH domain-containing protein n=1 Tax=Lophiostoma macrostomum CBS 122681 TaxID=1314788 RepID=A0A6A6TDE0_9PLEO|nr:hypothetical protein K491DRAFT_677687 [Lophiostoma macrostomum CBS 122681]
MADFNWDDYVLENGLTMLNEQWSDPQQTTTIHPLSEMPKPSTGRKDGSVIDDFTAFNSFLNNTSFGDPLFTPNDYLLSDLEVMQPFGETTAGGESTSESSPEPTSGIALNGPFTARTESSSQTPASTSTGLDQSPSMPLQQRPSVQRAQTYPNPAYESMFPNNMDPGFVEDLTFPDGPVGALHSQQSSVDRSVQPSTTTITKRTKAKTDILSACWTSPLCPNHDQDGPPPNPSSCGGGCAPFLFAPEDTLPTPIINNLLPEPQEVTAEDGIVEIQPRPKKRSESDASSEPSGRQFPNPNTSEVTRMKSESSHASPEEVQPTVEDNKPKSRRRLPHNQVERKYRESLNTQLESLRRVVPALQQNQGGCDGADIEDLPTPSKPSKAVILASATAYIKQVEKDKKSLAEENQLLRTRMKALQALVKCEDCSLMQYFMDLKINQQNPRAAPTTVPLRKDSVPPSCYGTEATTSRIESDVDDARPRLSYARVAIIPSCRRLIKTNSSSQEQLNRDRSIERRRERIRLNRYSAPNISTPHNLSEYVSLDDDEMAGGYIRIAHCAAPTDVDVDTFCFRSICCADVADAGWYGDGDRDVIVAICRAEVEVGVCPNCQASKPQSVYRSKRTICYMSSRHDAVIHKQKRKRWRGVALCSTKRSGHHAGGDHHCKAASAVKIAVMMNKVHPSASTSMAFPNVLDPSCYSPILADAHPPFSMHTHPHRPPLRHQSYTAPETMYKAVSAPHSPILRHRFHNQNLREEVEQNTEFTHSSGYDTMEDASNISLRGSYRPVSLESQHIQIIDQTLPSRPSGASIRPLSDHQNQNENVEHIRLQHQDQALPTVPIPKSSSRPPPARRHSTTSLLHTNHPHTLFPHTHMHLPNLELHIPHPYLPKLDMHMHMSDFSDAITHFLAPNAYNASVSSPTAYHEESCTHMHNQGVAYTSVSGAATGDSEQEIGRPHQRRGSKGAKKVEDGREVDRVDSLDMNVHVQKRHVRFEHNEMGLEGDGNKGEEQSEVNEMEGNIEKPYIDSEATCEDGGPICREAEIERWKVAEERKVAGDCLS